MATGLLVIGESGSGKSTSMRNLDPKKTFIISILGKDLPFRGWKKKYTEMEIEWSQSEDGFKPTPIKSGNHYCVPDDQFSWARVLVLLNLFLNNSKSPYETIIIDDFGYLITNEFLHRAYETGFTKFTQLARHIKDIIACIKENKNNDKFVVFMAQPQTVSETGFRKIKTAGKLLDDQVNIEGFFTSVLFTNTLDDKHVFETKRDNSTAKTPDGAFDEMYIDNDLDIVIKRLKEYSLED